MKKFIFILILMFTLTQSGFCLTDDPGEASENTGDSSGNFDTPMENTGDSSGNFDTTMENTGDSSGNFDTPSGIFDAPGENTGDSSAASDFSAQTLSK